MLFNSYGYLFLFLPLALAGYFALHRSSLMALAWLVAASLFFYAWWNPWHLPIVLGSMAFNFWVGRRILASNARKRRWLWCGIGGNLLLLGAFKYTHFALGIVAGLSGWQLVIPQIALPLGISFFTFTQIAYLVDTARGEVREANPVHYALFVSFFPHLLAGPIIHHKEMMPQFADATNRLFNPANFARGLFLLALGLGKKVLIADPLGDAANAGFAGVDALNLAGAWTTTLAYTFQIYFDFSGYTDMALGAALMFNIRLPVNFNSPYLAGDIQDFWRRWHITLSRFLRDYLYIPLGGNQAADTRIAANIMVTFLLGGLWHGAGWTFIVWGALHGAAMVVQRFWSAVAKPMPQWLAWFVTFVFVNVAWVFFRAASLGDALALLSGMAGGRGFVGTTTAIAPCLLIGICFGLAICGANSNALAEQPLTRRNAVLAVLALAAGLLSLSQTSPFIYFNF